MHEWLNDSRYRDPNDRAKFVTADPSTPDTPCGMYSIYTPDHEDAARCAKCPRCGSKFCHDPDNKICSDNLLRAKNDLIAQLRAENAKLERERNEARSAALDYQKERNAYQGSVNAMAEQIDQLRADVASAGERERERVVAYIEERVPGYEPDQYGVQDAQGALRNLADAIRNCEHLEGGTG